MVKCLLNGILKSMNIKNLGLFADKDGNNYEVIQVTKTVNSDPLSLSSPSTKHKGFKSFETSCGIDLNLKGEDYFTLDGVKLTKVT